MIADNFDWTKTWACALYISFAALVVVYSVKTWLESRKLPPGPVGVPLLGYIPFMKKNIAQSALDVTERYGSDVISLRLGRTLVVFLNSRDAIHEAYVTHGDVMSDRPDYLVKRLTKGKGILSSDGESWKYQRRITHGILREFASKPALVSRLHEETTHMFAELDRLQGRAFNPHYLLRTAVSNVICSLVFGQRYNYNDQKFVWYLRIFYENIQNFSKAAAILMMMPFLRLMPGDPFKFQSIVKNQEHITAFFDEHVRRHEKELDRQNVRDFIDGYLVEVEKSGEPLDRDQLHAVIGDLFKAGAETVSTTLRWAILYLVTNPKIQEKIHKEIESQVGENRLPDLSDRDNLPYTQACLLETMRCSTTSLFGAPHSNLTTDVIVKNHVIPRKTIVMSNYWAMNMDKKVFKNAENFDPSHFYDEETNTVINQEKITPFGIGRRFCLGDSVGKVQLFVLFTSLVQRFRFSLPPSSPPPSLDGLFSIIRSPVPYEVCAVTRTDE